jgi:hypothetical protein
LLYRFRVIKEDHMTDREVLIGEIAENIAIYNGVVNDEQFIPQAQQLLRSFEAIEGRLPRDYLEIETWSASRVDRSGRFLVLE